MKALVVLALPLLLAACSPSLSASREACQMGDQLACYDYVQGRYNRQMALQNMARFGQLLATPQQHYYAVTGF